MKILISITHLAQICLCALFAVVCFNSFSQTIGKYNKIGFGGEYNILIGKNAGMLLQNESYCVIIGEDSIATHIKGYDFIWYVDYKCKYLKGKPELIRCLKAIESFGLVTGEYEVIKKQRIKIYKIIKLYLE